MINQSPDPLADAVQAPVCPYCGKLTEFKRAGGAINDTRYRSRFIYICMDCQAWVGCHPGDIRPLGTPAKSELRELRVQAHQAFDSMREKTGMKRREAYSWLARMMDLELSKCHIGMFDESQCIMAINISLAQSLGGRINK